MNELCPEMQSCRFLSTPNNSLILTFLDFVDITLTYTWKGEFMPHDQLNIKVIFRKNTRWAIFKWPAAYLLLGWGGSFWRVCIWWRAAATPLGLWTFFFKKHILWGLDRSNRQIDFRFWVDSQILSWLSWQKKHDSRRKYLTIKRRLSEHQIMSNPPSCPPD